MIDIEQNKKDFLILLGKVLSDEEYIAVSTYLSNSDFFTAPASTRFHLAEKGGLCQHSLNVYTAAITLESAFHSDASKRSLTICSLLHDICKIYVYEEEYKNFKNYEESALKKANPRSIKHDVKGDYIWDVKVGYTFNDKFPFGHGSKSAYILTNLMDLTPEEAQAIRFHMGAYEEGDKARCSSCFDNNKLALLIHFADMYASKIIEKEG